MHFTSPSVGLSAYDECRGRPGPPSDSFLNAATSRIINIINTVGMLLLSNIEQRKQFRQHPLSALSHNATLLINVKRPAFSPSPTLDSASTATSSFAVLLEIQHPPQSSGAYLKTDVHATRGFTGKKRRRPASP